MSAHLKWWAEISQLKLVVAEKQGKVITPSGLSGRPTDGNPAPPSLRRGGE